MSPDSGQDTHVPLQGTLSQIQLSGSGLQLRVNAEKTSGVGVMAQVTGSLKPKWETQSEFLVLSFGISLTLAVVGTWEREPTDGSSLFIYQINSIF